MNKFKSLFKSLFKSHEEDPVARKIREMEAIAFIKEVVKKFELGDYKTSIEDPNVYIFYIGVDTRPKYVSLERILTGRNILMDIAEYESEDKIDKLNVLEFTPRKNKETFFSERKCEIIDIKWRF